MKKNILIKYSTYSLIKSNLKFKFYLEEFSFGKKKKTPHQNKTKTKNPKNSSMKKHVGNLVQTEVSLSFTHINVGFPHLR